MTVTPRELAPGELASVQRFINSADLEDGTDELRDVVGAVAWLRENLGLERGASLDEAARQRLLAVREGLRALALANNDGELDAAAVAAMRSAAGEVRLTPVVDNGGVRLAMCTGGVDGVIARLLSTVAESTVDGTWRRLKACRSHTCVWAFYDRSKNASGAWCRMDGSCGNRDKVRRYRARKRAERQPA